MDNTTPATSATQVATPTAHDHAKMNTFLAILERFGIVALTLAPAVSAPFLGPNASAIITAETPAAQALASVLAADLQTRTPGA